MRAWIRNTGALLVSSAHGVESGMRRLVLHRVRRHLAVDGYVYRGLPSEDGVAAVDSVVRKRDRVPMSGCTVTLEPWAL